MYDYLVVGSGLYGSVFAHEARSHGKSVLREKFLIIAIILNCLEKQCCKISVN